MTSPLSGMAWWEKNSTWGLHFLSFLLFSRICFIQGCLFFSPGLDLSWKSLLASVCLTKSLACFFFPCRFSIKWSAPGNASGLQSPVISHSGNSESRQLRIGLRRKKKNPPPGFQMHALLWYGWGLSVSSACHIAVLWHLGTSDIAGGMQGKHGWEHRPLGTAPLSVWVVES